MKKGHYMVTDLIDELKNRPSTIRMRQIIFGLENWVKVNGDIDFDPRDMEKFLLAKQMTR